MDDKELFITIFSGTWVLVGSIFLIIGIFIINSRKKKEQRCISSVWGKVKDITRHMSHTSNGGSSSTYHPVYEYTIGGLTYVKESAYGMSNLKVAIGQDVEIFYNPENPHDYYVPSDRTANFLGTFFKIFGIVSILIGVIVAVVVFNCF